MSKYIITAALPYANGPLHLGHIAGAYLPSDIYTRFLRLCKDTDVLFVCGSDEHGVPITLHAEQRNTTPEHIVQEYHEIMDRAFQYLSIQFDHFSGTHRPVHFQKSLEFFHDLLSNGHIEMQETSQFFDESAQRFLPDRYVEGTCPKCGYAQARGDQCDACGALLNALDLLRPLSVLTRTTPTVRQSTHAYLQLAHFSKALEEWVDSKHYWKDSVRRFVLGWIRGEGLHARAITRDMNWGVPLDLPEFQGKVLYVWFDAPIGYLSASIEWAETQGQPHRWKDYWMDKDTKLVHFIGKDNIPFHAVIWPAMLMGQNQPYPLPHDIPANQYLTLEGEKISTSRNWAVWVHELIGEFEPDMIRYALAANAPETQDADFRWHGFQSRVNDELANNLGNFIHRVLTFVQNQGGHVSAGARIAEEDQDFLAKVDGRIQAMYQALAQFRVREACAILMEISRLGNQYFDHQKPWALAKRDPARLTQVLRSCLMVLRALAVVMSPIMPGSARKLWAMLGQAAPLTEQLFLDALQAAYPAEFTLQDVAPLFMRLADEVVDAHIRKLKAQQINPTEEPKPMEEITIDTFKQMDLRVGLIEKAETLEHSRKLLKFQVRIGNETRQILSGIKEFYRPEELVGRKVVVIANLKPAKMAGELSEGMILSASTADDSIVCLLDPGDAPHGSSVY